MNISPTTLALIVVGAGFLGAVVPSFFALRMARLTKESEERRHHKEIVVKAALENWKQIATLFEKSQQKGTIGAFDTFLIHMAALADVVFDPTTTPQNLASRLERVDLFLKIARDSIKGTTSG